MPQKLGQHFLINQNKLKEIISTIDPKEDDFIIEIGPGHGELTKEIIREFANRDIKKYKLLSVEKDQILISSLNKLAEENKNLEIINADIREFLPSLFSLSSLSTSHSSSFTSFPLPLTTNYKLIGNIPYYLTGFLLRIISELENKPSNVVLLIQKEVAERICAVAPRMNLLAASVQYWGEPSIITTVSKNDFNPPPKVESAVIKIITKDIDLQKIDQEKYYKYIKNIFSQPRKNILNNVAFLGTNKKELEALLNSINIDPKKRPQDLSFDDIVHIVALFNEDE